MLCQSNPGKCTIKNVVYKYSCLDCEEKGASAHYYGESSRMSWERAQEHQRFLRKMDKESPLVEHYVDHHPEKKEPKYILEMVKSFKTPLER